MEKTPGSAWVSKASFTSVPGPSGISDTGRVADSTCSGGRTILVTDEGAGGGDAGEAHASAEVVGEAEGLPHHAVRVEHGKRGVPAANRVTMPFLSKFSKEVLSTWSEERPVSLRPEASKASTRTRCCVYWPPRPGPGASACETRGPEVVSVAESSKVHTKRVGTKGLGAGCPGATGLSITRAKNS
ncbi:hypothetical protein ACN28S_61790 [Cystobacter fuscus]